MSRGTGGARSVAPALTGLLAAGLLAACSGAAASSSSVAASASSSTVATSPAAATPATSGTPRAASAASAAPSAPLATVPSRTRTTLPPAPTSTPVDVAGRARAALVGSRSVTVAGQGPGELSGPGVALTLKVTNPSGPSLDLGAVTVTADVAGQEASPSTAAPARPLTGTLRPGGTATGVYVFVLPAGTARPVAVVVSLAPELPVARFTVR
jgi:hypothetical protein